MKMFISCDWGSSAFRLRLVEAATNAVINEIMTETGIISTFKLYESNQTTTDRFSFYKAVLAKQVLLLEHQCGYTLDSIPIVVSGMASSGMGMFELPYKQHPFRADMVDLVSHVIGPAKDFNHHIVMVSGVSSATDIMRGEETMLLGCKIEYNEEEKIFIFPGTHSKHIIVKKGVVQHFKTYMTGEIFDLLCNKSVLSASVEKDDKLMPAPCHPHFINGVKEGAETNILNSIFHVRTNEVLKKLGKKENYHYLSGLLIGAELKVLIQNKLSSVTLVSSGTLGTLYLQAIHTLGMSENVHQKNAAEALVNGQSIILHAQYGLL